MEPAQHQRIISLDAFRGFVIAAMILVDSLSSRGAVYSQLRHARWNGWTFADTVFPFFLFIMGISIELSFTSRKENGITRSHLYLQIMRRTVILFALGLFMSNYPAFRLSTFRIPGILQRIALCYFFTSLIVHKYGPRVQSYWLFGLLASYWLMMRFIPVPGVGVGLLEPGRNFASYVDSLFLKGHMSPYHVTWDPEGLVSTIPAIGTTLFGALCGNLLLSTMSQCKKAIIMICAGVALLFLGIILSLLLPLNKYLWTSTFSIFMAGLSFLFFSIFYYLIDVKGYKSWATVFVIFGMNSIAIYCLPEILDPLLRLVLYGMADLVMGLRSCLFRGFLLPFASPENISLLFGFSYVFLMFLIAWTLWKMRIFIKL